MLEHGPVHSMPLAALGRRTPMDVRRMLAERIREHRIARQWTQRDMAGRAGIAFETYRVFERTGRASLDRFLRLLDVLGLLDEVELARPTPFHSIDEVVRQNADQPRTGFRTRVRLPKRPPKQSPHTEPLR